jgi:hypothetical protein
MTLKEPPRIAAWMLEHFGSGPNNETLMGDLAEQYREKESAIWYWRQALKAIPVSFAREIRHHKLTAGRALLTGWGMWILCLLLLFPFLARLYFGVPAAYSMRWVPPLSRRYLLGSAISLLWQPVIGQAAIPYGIEGPEKPLSYVFGIALPFAVWAACGWLVAHRFREQQTAVVLLLAVSNLSLALLLFGPYIHRLSAFGIPLHIAPIAANVVASFLGILCGGALFNRRLRRVI